MGFHDFLLPHRHSSAATLRGRNGGAHDSAFMGQTPHERRLIYWKETTMKLNMF